MELWLTGFPDGIISFHLAMELMMSRCAALSLFVSVSGGIPVTIVSRHTQHLLKK
jgi:hypothetical protein